MKLSTIFLFLGTISGSAWGSDRCRTILRATFMAGPIPLTQEERIWRDLGAPGKTGADALQQFQKLGEKIFPQIRRNLLEDRSG